MKRNLKFLISSALVALTFSVSQNTLAMEGKPEHIPAGLLQSASTTGNPFDDFLQDSPLYHQVATERYQTSVRVLRQEILKLQDNIASLGTNSGVSAVEKEIENYKEMITLQQEALTKYGSDQNVAQQKISKEIEAIKKDIQSNQQNITSTPHLKGLYEAQIKDAGNRLTACEKYLASLDKSAATLQASLEIAQTYLKTLDQQSSSAEHLKATMLEKIKTLQGLYENHVKGGCPSDIFPQEFPKLVLEGLGISSAQFNNAHPQRLFQLFARSLELPYAFIHTGKEKEESYLRQLGIVKQNLDHRLREDIFALQLSESIAKNGNVKIDLTNQNTQIEKLLMNPQSLEGLVNKEHDLEILKEVVLSYGYGSSNSFQLLEAFLNATPYGLLGLYIASLEYAPVTSWNNAAKIASPTRVKDAKSGEEFSDAVVEIVCHILGRHLNKQVLSKIQETLQGHAKITTTTSIQDGFYV